MKLRDFNHQHFLKQPCIYPGSHNKLLSLKVLEQRCKEEEVIVYIELHELKWVLALMCLEANWETETALVRGSM